MDGALHKQIACENISNIEDIKVTKTPLGQLLNFGNLEIRTKSNETLEIRNIASPDKFKILIQSLHDDT
jgi:hypothetical protein